MYAVRLLSDLQKSPELLAASPDGLNSGYLVIQDEESKKVQSCLSWSKKSEFVKKLPFPQNKEVLVEYGTNEDGYSRFGSVLFIPVLNRSLSHDCYYAIVPRGDNKGKAFTSSSKEDMETTTSSCCVSPGQRIVDVSPTPLDPINLYQQFNIIPISMLCSPLDHFFRATTLTPDGLVPFPLRRQNVCRNEYWQISFQDTLNNNNLKLDATAQGLDPMLRALRPKFKLPLSQKLFVVGKWYSFFTFVKEGTESEQVTKTIYYEVTLEQRWEKFFAWIKDDDDDGRISNGARRVAMNNVVLESVEVFVGGRKARWNEGSDQSGVFWYTSDGGARVGLRKEIVERMNWEQERGGWVKDKKVDFVDECPEEEGGDWSEFGRYVLVERFNFRRMDGSLVISFDFKHFNQMRTHCE